MSGLKPGLFFRVEGVHCCHEVSTLTQGTTQQLNSLVAQEAQGRTDVPRSQWRSCLGKGNANEVEEKECLSGSRVRFMAIFW